MKLRNKKTGVIIETFSIHEDYRGKIVIGKKDIENYPYKYNTLAELNEEWENYEEPKGIQGFTTQDEDIIIRMSSIEEAEKAVEKLKAW